MKNVIRRALVCAFGCAIGLSAIPASAAVKVGDKPALSFKATDGTPVNLDKFKGKIVVVDFWATWCGPCMAMAPEMVSMNKEWSAKGLQIIGISLDQDQAKMTQVAKQKEFTWPQYFDGQGWENKIWATWGEDGIPFTVLIGPDGAILWKGNAGALKPELEKAFKEHPPQLVDPKLVKQAQDLLVQIQAKMDKSDAAGAIKLMSQLPKEAKADKDLSAKVDELNTQLNEAAEKMLAEVDPLIDAKDYLGAVTKLKDLSTALAGSPVGAQAKGKLTELSAKPEVKAAIDRAKTEKASADALDAAKKLKAAGKNEQAYPKFKSIVATYAGTVAATEAAKVVKDYEKDASFVHKVSDEEAGAKAKGALSVARNYAKLGKVDQARKKYESIIKDFAGSSVADTATQELAALPQS